MSYRNFSRLVSNTIFSSKNHSYLLVNQGVTFHPASLYYNPYLPLLQKGHNQTPFSLGLVAYGLVRQNVNFSKFVTTKNEVSSEIEKTALKNSQTIETYLKEFRDLVKAGSSDVPAQVCSNFIFASEFGGQSQPNFYKEFIFPVLKRKISHIDFRSAAELIVSLEKAKLLDDKELIKNLVSVLITKSANRPHYVEFHAWKLNQFDQATQSQGEKFFYSEAHRFYQESQGASLAQLKHWVRETLSLLKNRLLYPFLYRETRVYAEFDAINEEEEKLSLLTALKEVQGKYGDIKVGELLEKLKIDHK